MTWQRTDKQATRAGGRYDSRHKKARALAARRHDPADPCCRCGRSLGPMGRWLHYDHAEDGSYLGFSHRSCNIQAGAVKGNRVSRGIATLHRWTL